MTEIEYQQGRQIANNIISCLATASERYSYLPRIYRSESFLAGSLGRRTQERPLHDIDLYLVINGGGLYVDPDSFTVPLNLYGSMPNPSATDPRYLEGQWVSSAKILQAFWTPVCDVARTYGASPGGSSKHKTLYLKWQNLNVDLSFVLRGQAPRVDNDRYYLPTGGGAAWWSPTNPKLDQARLSERNQAGGGELIPLIRMLKWWDRNQNQDRLKGIHLEVMIENAFAYVTPYPVFAALCYLFHSLQAMVLESCPDPTGLGEPLDSSLSPGNRSASLQQLTLASQWMQLAATEVIKGDEGAAKYYLRNVFPVT